MNLLVGAPVWLAVLLIVILGAAAIEDAIRLRISNLTVLAAGVAAFVGIAVTGISPAVWQNVVVCITLLVVGTFAFSAGWLGGGDVKLLSALGLWTDFRSALWLLACIFLAGGILALASVGASLFRRRSANWRKRRIPYGIAIAAGSLLAIGLASGEGQREPHRLPPVKVLKSEV